MISLIFFDPKCHLIDGLVNSDLASPTHLFIIVNIINKQAIQQSNIKHQMLLQNLVFTLQHLNLTLQLIVSIVCGYWRLRIRRSIWFLADCALVSVAMRKGSLIIISTECSEMRIKYLWSSWLIFLYNSNWRFGATFVWMLAMAVVTVILIALQFSIKIIILLTN
jgi:hypothetical protein